MSTWTYTRPEGFVDDDPASTRRIAAVETTILDVCRAHGFERVMVPTLEYADLYHRRRIGSDLYHQLMVSRIAEAREFPARMEPGEGVDEEVEATHEVVLRPDLTAPVARSFVTRLLEHGVPGRLPVRVCYSGQVFRNVSPGFGRLKEFRQAGVESVGARGRVVDLDVVLLACDAACALGIEDRYVSVGHAGLCAALVESLGVTAEPARDAVVAGIQRLHQLRQRARADGDALHRVVRRYAGACHRQDSPAFWRHGIDTVDEETLRTRLLEDLASRLERAWREAWGIDSRTSRRLLALAELDPDPGTFGQELEALVPLQGDLEAMLDDMVWLAGQVRSRREVSVELTPVSGRPIGYYTGVTFEWFAAAGGDLVRFCGGGRYDRLYRWIYDRAVATAGAADARDPGAPPENLFSAVGFAFGLERVLEVVGHGPASDARGIRIVGADPALDLAALTVADRLRSQVQLPVVWCPARAGGGAAARDRATGTRPASAGVEIVVEGSTGEMVSVVERSSGWTWTGSLEQAASVLAGRERDSGESAGGKRKQ